MLLYFYCPFKSRKVFSFIALICPVLVLAVLYWIRPDSVIGRLQIWRICLEMVEDRPLLGFGMHGFSKSYMDYQAVFFRNNPSGHYVMLADDVMCPYNEFIHFLVNYGFFGFTIACVGISYLLNIGIRDKSPFCAMMIAILAFALFSFPSGEPFLITVFIFLSGLVWTHCFYARIKTIILSIILLFSMTAGFVHQYTFNEISNMAETHVDITEPIKLNVIYSSPLLIDFYLSASNDINIVIDERFLRRALTLSPSSRLLCLAAEHYMELGNAELAEHHLKRAMMMVPWRLEPMYKLLQLYISQNRLKEASHIGNLLLAQPLKVEGAKAALLKNKTRKILYENNLQL